MKTNVLDSPIVDRIDLESIKRKRINIAIFGHGNVGSQLIDQIIASREEIGRRRNIDLNIFAVGNSKTLLLQRNGVESKWRRQKELVKPGYSVAEVIAFAKTHNLQNLILVDNTADQDFVTNYPTFEKKDFTWFLQIKLPILSI